MKKTILLCARLVSYVILAVICWFSCGFLGAKWVWGEVDMAMVIQHTQLLFTVPWAPYWKELTAGFTGFFILTFIACRYWKISMAIVLACTLFYVGKNAYSAYMGEANFYSKHYIIPRVKSVQSPKNIIVVSLESVDDMVTNPDVVLGGENLIPALTALKAQGVSVRGYHRISSMMPTIPAFYAMNCGITRGAGNWETFENLFSSYNLGAFPNAVCVSDILKKHAYKNMFVMGAKLTDEGVGHFFEKHLFDVVMGKDELQQAGYKMLNSTYRIPDSELFRFTQDFLTQTPKDNPFFVYVVTGNTHGPKEFVREPFCEEKYHDGRDAYKCLDRMTADFVSWCQKQSWYKNTVIFLVGDHQAWGDSDGFNGKVAQKIRNKRQIYNVVLNGGQSVQTGEIKKDFTQVDIAPTILESAGFDIRPHQLGLGVSLWTQTPTFVEKLGRRKFQRLLNKAGADYQQILYGKKFQTND